MSSASVTDATISLGALLRAAERNPELLHIPFDPNAVTEDEAEPVDGDEDVAASDAELHSVIPPPPPPPPPPPLPEIVAEPEPEKPKKVGFEFTGETLAGTNVTPASDPALLHRLAQTAQLPTLPLKQSGELRAVVRECELLIFAQSGPRPPTTVRDLRKLLALYDDFALEWRPRLAGVEQQEDDVTVEVRIDRAHQIALFVARMKLLYAIRVAQPRETNASRLLYDPVLMPADYYWGRAANDVTDSHLAAWLRDNGACHQSLLGDITSNQPLQISTCSLTGLWQSMLTLLRVWPTLPMCAELVRFFDELRLRVAFFMSYRERAPESFDDDDDDDGGDSDSDDNDAPKKTLTIEQRIAKNNEKIMGLNLNLFGLLDLNAMVKGEAKIGGANRGAPVPPALSDEPLIDEWDMARITRGADGVAYSHINADFFDECERVLHALQRILRCQAGFARPPSAPNKCIACHQDTLRVAAAQLDRLQTMITENLEGPFRSVIEEQFREQVFQAYIEPSELEQFTEYHPQEVHNDLNCISKRRNADFKVLSSRYIEPQANVAWQFLQPLLDEPAHVVLAALAINFTMRQDVRGAQLEPYYILPTQLDPMPYLTPVNGKGLRKLGYETYECLVTTGSLRFRYQLLQRDGAEADHAHMDYQHPLIVKMCNSHALLYEGHLHECDSFEEAFLKWLLAMCLDEHIGGILANGASLQQMASRLMPERNAELQASLKRTEERIRKWNPMAKVVRMDEIALPKDKKATTASYFPMHDEMTQF